MKDNHQVYLLRDSDRNIYKIGKRSDNVRFLSESSFRRNNYCPDRDIKEISSSRRMSKNEVSSLETMLHKLYEDKNVPYPPVTLSETLPDGRVFTWTKERNGHTEWFNLSEDDVNNVMDILSHSWHIRPLQLHTQSTHIDTHD